MAAVSKLEITNVFADETKAKVTIDNIKPENISGNVESIRQQVMNFNNNNGGNLATKMKSKNGFNWTGISQVRIITTDTTYIF